MDNDRYRSNDRRVVNGSSSDRASSRQSEESRAEDRQAYQPQRQVEAPVQQQVNSKSKRSPFLWVVIIILTLALAGAVAWFFLNNKDTETGINTSKYQAVFLSNGQHYFGKLERMNEDYFKLSDVYYLEQKDPTDTTASSKTPVELRKLGDKEIHGPEDTMIISKQQVLLYENLTDNSQVVKSIDQYKQQAR